MFEQSKVYRTNNGDTLVIASGGTLQLDAGSTATVGGSAIVFGETGLTVGEVAYLVGVTAGTVAASKAVVVDANKDAGDFRNLDCVNLDAGASGTAGSVDIFPATATKGKLSIVCANQAGNTTVTLQADAMGQASTVHLPDPGAAAAYLVQSTAALALAEVDVLQDVTPGTVAAGKAVVVDANKDAGDFRHLKLLGVDFEAGGTDITFRIVDGKLIVSNLPTVDPATAGALWSDSGTLKISAGT